MINQCVNNINIPCLRHSKILKCCITKGNLIITTNIKYKSILIDILKSIPSLAIFMLPGGAILLPLFIKFIPKLLPSAFDENRIND